MTEDQSLEGKCPTCSRPLPSSKGELMGELRMHLFEITSRSSVPEPLQRLWTVDRQKETIAKALELLDAVYSVGMSPPKAKEVVEHAVREIIVELDKRYNKSSRPAPGRPRARGW